MTHFKTNIHPGIIGFCEDSLRVLILHVIDGFVDKKVELERDEIFFTINPSFSFEVSELWQRSRSLIDYIANHFYRAAIFRNAKTWKSFLSQFRMAAHSYATITTTTTTTTIIPPRDHNHYLFRRLTPSARYALTTAIHRRRVRLFIRRTLRSWHDNRC